MAVVLFTFFWVSYNISNIAHCIAEQKYLKILTVEEISCNLKSIAFTVFSLPTFYI